MTAIRYPLWTLIAALFTCSSHAGLIVDTIGDKDGFGISVPVGWSFSYQSVRADDAADVGTDTDTWDFGGRSWEHVIDFSGLGTVTAASLELVAGGLGYGGPASLYLNDVFVGLLSDGDSFDGGDRRNRARLDHFDLMPFVNLLTGPTITFRVDPVGGGDGWVLDYSELMIETVAAAVSEPATIALIGLAALGVGLRRRRRSGERVAIAQAGKT